LSSEITLFGLPTLWFGGEGKTVRYAIASGVPDLRSHRTGACTQALCTETGRSQRETRYNPELVRLEKASGRTSNFYTSGKSDGGIISMKRMNKGEQPNISGQTLAEFVEQRGTKIYDLPICCITLTSNDCMVPTGHWTIMRLSELMV